LLALCLLLVAGCDAEVEVEGDEPGECSDQTDNDQDGVADCDDDGCAADGACTGDDDDTAGDDDDTGDDDTSGDDDMGDDDSAGDDDDTAPVDADNDGVPAAEDCDDNDANLGAMAEDGDCDGALTAADCNDAEVALGAIAADADCDGALTAADCNDADSSIYPGAPDNSIDAIDQNCDGVDGPDADGDGYVDVVAGGDDCNDSDPGVSPGAAEVWGDGIDQDCDGIADVAGGACTASFTVEFPDGSSTTLDGCLDWSLEAAFDYDPDDPPEVRSFTLNFGATTSVGFECEVTVIQDEVCGTGYYDAADAANTTSYALMDCSGVANQFEQTYTASTGYLHVATLDTGLISGNFTGLPLETTVEGYLSVDDGTGVRLSGSFSLTLEQVVADEEQQTTCAVSDGDEDDDGEVDAYYDGADCDDSDLLNFAANPEVCDGQDNDCGSDIDEDFDVDGDGFFTGVDSGCVATYTITDCDDGDPANFPANPELCDGQDNDCNGLDDAGNPGVDDEEVDNDTDGQWECQGDCDDSDALNFTTNPEVCDGQDNDCNGLDDAGNPGVDDQESDDDGDGEWECQGDCDDSDALNFAANPEVCDGQDNDCDGNPDNGFPDQDGDGTGDCVDNCNDDSYENNDTSSAATVLPPSMFSDTGLNACPGDDDWYEYPVAVGEILEVEVLFSHATGDIDVELFTPAGAFSDASYSSSDYESLQVTIPTAGYWQIRVYLWSDDADPGNNYNLIIRYLPPPP
jgi:hypothetical protein